MSTVGPQFYFFLSRDKENLAVITDHGVIEKLAKLAQTEDDILRAKLAEAIANCCEWPGNRALFGQSGAVAPLVSYLGSNDLEVHRTTSVALFQLSKDPWNCVTMHQHGVVGHLLRLIGRVLFFLFTTRGKARFARLPLDWAKKYLVLRTAGVRLLLVEYLL